MPRTRQTQTGAPAQAAIPVAGQTYGMGVEQQRMQEAMPLPQVAGATNVAPAGVGSAPAAAPAPTSADAFDHAQMMPSAGAGLLALPTQRPYEPVTHGLVSGPGGGPEVLGSPASTPNGQWMRDLAARSGNPYMQALADRLNA